MKTMREITANDVSRASLKHNFDDGDDTGRVHGSSVSRDPGFLQRIQDRDCPRWQDRGGEPIVRPVADNKSIALESHRMGLSLTYLSRDTTRKVVVI
jgi:hypothetical protein